MVTAIYVERLRDEFYIACREIGSSEKESGKYYPSFTIKAYKKAKKVLKKVNRNNPLLSLVEFTKHNDFEIRDGFKEKYGERGLDLYIQDVLREANNRIAAKEESIVQISL